MWCHTDKAEEKKSVNENVKMCEWLLSKSLTFVFLLLTQKD